MGLGLDHLHLNNEQHKLGMGILMLLDKLLYALLSLSMDLLVQLDRLSKPMNQPHQLHNQLGQRAKLQ